MTGQSAAPADVITVADNKALIGTSPQGFQKPYSYLFYNMDVQIMTVPTIPPTSTTPTPANMSISTKAFVS